MTVSVGVAPVRVAVADKVAVRVIVIVGVVLGVRDCAGGAVAALVLVGDKVRVLVSERVGDRVRLLVAVLVSEGTYAITWVAVTGNGVLVCIMVAVRVAVRVALNGVAMVAVIAFTVVGMILGGFDIL